MNYIRIYNSIIKKALNSRRNKSNNIYYENHHIKPKCCGGNNISANLVLLTPREHFLCHWLLVKIFPKNKRLLHAWNCFCMNTYNGQRPTSHLYKYARLNYIKYFTAKIKTGEFKPHSPKNTNWINKEKKCKRVRSEDLQKFLDDGWSLGRIIEKRKPHSKKTKEKIRKSLTGVRCSEETKMLHSRNSKNRVWIYNEKDECKMVKNTELTDWLKIGWKKGRIIKKKP